MKLSRRLALASTVAALAGGAPATLAARTPKGKSKEPVPEGSPGDTPLGPVDTVAKWAFIQDFTTGAVLLDKSADEPMPPSSMTKLMTIYLTYEQLAKGQIKLTDTVIVSARAAAMGGSRMFLEVGKPVGIEDLIRGVIVDSGNDAATVLAEAIGGNQEHFVDMMNAKAKELGMTHATFRNPTGWPDPEQAMSCRDIAIVASHIITDFPQYYHYDSERTFKYNNIEQENRQPMVQAGTADGLKTGHTDAGGFGLVSSSLRDGRRVVMVLNGMTSMHERAGESEKLMNWAFANFENVHLFSANEVIDNAQVWLGTEKTVSLVGAKDTIVTLPKSWRQTASIRISYDAPIKAPIAKGQPLGVMTLRGHGVPTMDINLVAGADVDRLNLPMRGLAVVTHFVSGG
ncbi:MAG TPA: D-alanyl-D-alanine carboxypeptidase family protein [Acetobacteraceae bacterium]|nr:D-alanyl-D-alanine carboxypeptidase family protein [Acetobacteraceae bacterium]